MWEDLAAAGVRRGTTRLRLGVAALCVVALVSGGCSDDDPSATAASDPGETNSSSEESPSESPSTMETADPKPLKPKEPKFRSGKKGQKAFTRYIVDGWGYSLITNDPSVLIDASGKKACRGCGSLRKELKQREKEGWYVDFPGAKVRKISFSSRGDVREATAVVDIPGSRSFFEDGTFRNDNEAHRSAKFLIDFEAKGKNKKRHWELVAFSVK